MWQNDNFSKLPCLAKHFAAQGGDLHDALHLGEKRMEWKAGGCRLAAQIALGLSKLHERKVCKSETVVLTTSSHNFPAWPGPALPNAWRGLITLVMEQSPGLNYNLTPGLLH